MTSRRNTVTATVPVGSAPCGVAANATTDTVYVADYGSNTVSVITSVTTPGAHTGVSVTAGNGQASVTFSPPASDGGSAITGYTVTATDTTMPGNGGQTATGTGSPPVVTGLTNGDANTFTVTATNGEPRTDTAGPAGSIGDDVVGRDRFGPPAAGRAGRASADRRIGRNRCRTVTRPLREATHQLSRGTVVSAFTPRRS